MNALVCFYEGFFCLLFWVKECRNILDLGY